MVIGRSTHPAYTKDRDPEPKRPGARAHRVRVEHVYGPRGACKTLFSARDGEVLVSGPAGTGKSRACLEKLHRAALKYPGMRGLIARKTATSLTSTALVTWREKVAPEALAHGLCQWYGGSSQEAAGYRYRNGSVVNVGGLDKSERIMSSEYDLAYVQEATELTVTDWEAITTRLRNGVMPYQQLIADCNPSTPYHWLKKRCDSGACRMLNSRHEDNPSLFDATGEMTDRGATYIAKLDALTGVRKQRLRHGLWVAAEGLIYDEWDRETHVVPSFGIPPEWPRYWSIDFGFVNPFVLQCWAEDPDGRSYLYRELYRSRRLVEDHARDILSIVAPRGAWIEPKPIKVICDHDAEGRETLQRHLGLGTTAAKKGVSGGIQAVSSRLKVQSDGKPRLFLVEDARVHRDDDLAEAGKPTCTAEEIPGYARERLADGSTSKEQPRKEDDHGCDALRYYVAERDLKQRFSVRY